MASTHKRDQIKSHQFTMFEKSQFLEVNFYHIERWWLRFVLRRPLEIETYKHPLIVSPFSKNDVQHISNFVLQREIWGQFVVP